MASQDLGLLRRCGFSSCFLRRLRRRPSVRDLRRSQLPRSDLIAHPLADSLVIQLSRYALDLHYSELPVPHLAKTRVDRVPSRAACLSVKISTRNHSFQSPPSNSSCPSSSRPAYSRRHRNGHTSRPTISNIIYLPSRRPPA
jgi:hypothetical protein